MGVAVAQQVVHNVVSHNHVVGSLVVVSGGKAAAQCNVQVVERNHRPRNAANPGVAAGVPVENHAAGAVQSHTHLAALRARVPNRFVVFDAQNLALLKPQVLLGREDHARHPPHRKHVGAVAHELGAHIVVGAVHQRNDHDDRGHAHHTPISVSRVRSLLLQRDCSASLKASESCMVLLSLREQPAPYPAARRVRDRDSAFWGTKQGPFLVPPSVRKLRHDNMDGPTLCLAFF